MQQSGHEDTAILDEEVLRALLLQMSDDRQAQEEIIKEYLDEAGSQVTLLLDAVAAGDLHAAQIVAHTWRSTSSLLGARRLAVVLRRLEQSVAEVPDEVAAIAQLVEFEFVHVKEALSRFVPVALG